MPLAPTGFVTTVLGALSPGALGATLMHEHVLADVTLPELRGAPEVPITLANRFEAAYRPERFPGNHRLTDVDLAVREVEPFRAAGGGAIVDVSIVGLRPDPVGLKTVAARTGVAIILGCGWYVDDYVDDAHRAMDEGALEAEFDGWLETGIDGSGVFPGIVGEIGCSYPLTDFERRSLKVAARKAARAGLALTIHPGRDRRAPAEIVAIAAREGLDPQRLVMGHIDRTLFERADMLALAGAGATLEFDFCGVETSRYWAGRADLPTDYMRIDHARALFDAGFGDQVLFSHDICTKSRLSAFGGHGYAHILANMVPLLRDKGFSQAEIDRILIDTPARLLTRI